MKKLDFSGLPTEVKKTIVAIGVAADERGLSIWLVGGMVRDILLRQSSRDIDVVVEGDGVAFAGILAQRLGGKFLAHKRFGTAVIDLADDLRVDVVTARRETYARPGILPEVFPGQIADDLFRRDFSVNAIAASLNKGSFGEIRDDFDGMDDLDAGLVRIMHYRSFVDDPTRILRAARYEKRFDFRIEPRTLSALKVACQQDAFTTITPVRYFQEFRRIMEEDNPLPILRRLRALDGLKYSLFGPSEEKVLTKIIAREPKDRPSFKREPFLLYDRAAALLMFQDKRKIEKLLLDFNIARADKKILMERVAFLKSSDMLSALHGQKFTATKKE